MGISESSIALCPPIRVVSCTDNGTQADPCSGRPPPFILYSKVSPHLLAC